MSTADAAPDREHRPVDLSRVLVVVPTYDGHENLPVIVGRVRAALPQVHLLVADDASPDDTGQLADELAADDDHVHVLHRAAKQGLGAAYLTAFAWGLERGTSKMSSAIVRESLWRVTAWGLARRGEQLGRQGHRPQAASAPTSGLAVDQLSGDERAHDRSSGS